MNPDTPTVDEILDCYNDKCAEQTCENCKLSLGNTSDSTNECAIRYTVAVLTGEMELGDSFRKEEPKPEPKPEPKLPAWCKVGQWVTEDHPEHSFGRIVRIHPDNYIGIVWVRHIDRLDGSNRPVKNLKPIRFRPYTFEEAETLFLKTLRFTRTSRRRRGSEIVTSVIEGDDGLWINGATFNTLANNYHATIDDIPVGVPEVDKKALKKALKEVNHE